MQTLPIDAVLGEIVEVLRRSPCVVVEAPPGAGKTTRVPPALLLEFAGEIAVLEPRRLAARMAARRIASELGEAVGETVGYRIRFEECGGARTRLWFQTEGVLTRRMKGDRLLAGTSVVILDEFHERHLDTDVGIAMLRRLQRTSRPDLRIVVMSATLDALPVAAFLGDAPIVRSEGRLFPIEVRYTPESASPLEDRVAAAFEQIVQSGLDGVVLVFLPGAAEIRRAQVRCQAIADRAGAVVVTLHGDLSSDEQNRAVQPAARPKLILSTNVAESSITIEGVTAVIDSGLARIAVDSPWTGLPSLNVARISRASAKQRAGRAGRVRPGRVIRLFTEDDYARRPEHDAPEILRRELSQVLLDLRPLDVADFEWLDAPPPAAVGAAEELLERLVRLARLRGTWRDCRCIRGWLESSWKRNVVVWRRVVVRWRLC